MRECWAEVPAVCFPCLARAGDLPDPLPLRELRVEAGERRDGHWWWVSAAVPPPCPLSSESRDIPEMTEQEWLPLCVSGRLKLGLGRTDAQGHRRDRARSGRQGLLTSPRALSPRDESKAERGVEEAHPRSSAICNHGVVQKAWSARENQSPFLK